MERNTPTADEEQTPFIPGEQQVSRVDERVANEVLPETPQIPDDQKIVAGNAWKSTGKILYDVFPNLVSAVCFFLITSIDLSVVSKLNDTTIYSGLGLGMTWAALTTKNVIGSLNQGTITISSQAFGAGNFTTVGLCFHRALTNRLIGSIFHITLLALANLILSALQVEESIATQATTYCRYFMLAVIPYILLDTFGSFLVSHQVFYPIMVIKMIGLAFHWYVCNYFVIDLGLELKGAALADAATLSLLSLLVIGYVFICNKVKKSLFAPRKESFQKLFDQMKIEIVIAAFFYLEGIAMQILTLIGGSYSSIQVSAQAAVSNITQLASMPMCGLNTVLTTYIASLLGKKSISDLKKCIYYGIFIAFAYGVIALSVILIWRRQILGYYSTNDEVIELGIKIILVYSPFFLIDYVRSVLVSALKSIGKEKIGSIAFLISYYVVGLLCEYLFGTTFKFYDQGLWVGVGLGTTTMLVTVTVLLLKTDLNVQASQIEKRINYLD